MKFWHEVFHPKMETKDSWFGVAMTMYILAFFSFIAAVGAVLAATALFLRMGAIAWARST